MKGYLVLFFKEMIKLNSIDILIFCFLINLNISSYLIREIQILFAALIIRKVLIDHIHTKSIKSVLFLSGTKTNKVIALNFLFNHSIFVLISVIMLLLKITTVDYILENLIILNLLISISAIIKFLIPFYLIEDSFFRNLSQTFIYVTFFGLFFLGQSISLTFILTSYALIYYFLNRTINYYDIN